MSSALASLWQPLGIGRVELRNRVFVPAHGVNLPGARYEAYLGARARGGAALLLTGAVPVHPTALVMDGLIEGWRDSATSTYRRLAAAVHEHGSLLFVQLYHVGAQATGRTGLDWQPVLAPSDVPSPLFGRVPKSMDADDIATIVEAFGSAAARARAGGADGVEVHGAHGYLIQQFLSPLTNLREDEYGGSAENRCRFALEVGAAIRRACGDDFPVGLRVGLDDFAGPAGLTPPTAEQWLRILDGSSLFDYVSVSGGNYGALHRLVAPMASGQEALFAEHARIARAACRDETPVLLTGAIHDLGRAASLVADGVADAVGMVRAHIADPELVEKARGGRGEEIRRCVGANQGCWRRALAGQMVTCTVNPDAGREVDRSRRPSRAAKRRRVLVVGGGPAGLKAAEAAAERGHSVTVLERSRRLGGQLAVAALLPHRRRWADAIDDLAGSLSRLGVEVRLGVEATPDLVAEHEPEATVVATGARWDPAPPAPFSEPASQDASGVAVVDPTTAILDPSSCAGPIAIVDSSGEYAPLGLAELLASAGTEVELVSERPALGEGLGPTGTADLPWVLPRLLELGVRMTTGVTPERVEAGGVRVVDRHGAARTVAAATVVPFGRRAAEGELAAALRARGVTTSAIGDCVAPRDADDAFFEGMSCGAEL